MGLVGELLERAARATPAPVEDRSSGWWLRHTDGSAWWSGAVLAHGATDAGVLTERIADAERFYAERGAPARFQVCPCCPAGLDVALGERGYRWESLISVQAARCQGLAEPHPVPGLEVRVASQVEEAWLAVLRSTGVSRTSAEHEARLLQQVPMPTQYVTVFDGREPVAIGRAVVDDGWTGVFGMATAPRARRRGAARLALATIAVWTGEQDASGLYLQVERSNTPAMRLYQAAGFAEVATYHYRVKDVRAPAHPWARPARLDPEHEVTASALPR